MPVGIDGCTTLTCTWGEERTPGKAVLRVITTAGLTSEGEPLSNRNIHIIDGTSKHIPCREIHLRLISGEAREA
jgi:hypothetical protein